MNVHKLLFHHKIISLKLEQKSTIYLNNIDLATYFQAKLTKTGFGKVPIDS